MIFELGDEKVVITCQITYISPHGRISGRKAIGIGLSRSREGPRNQTAGIEVSSAVSSSSALDDSLLLRVRLPLFLPLLVLGRLHLLLLLLLRRRYRRRLPKPPASTLPSTPLGSTLPSTLASPHPGTPVGALTSIRVWHHSSVHPCDRSLNSAARHLSSITCN